MVDIHDIRTARNFLADALARVDNLKLRLCLIEAVTGALMKHWSRHMVDFTADRLLQLKIDTEDELE